MAKGDGLVVALIASLKAQVASACAALPQTWKDSAGADKPVDALDLKRASFVSDLVAANSAAILDAAKADLAA